MSIIRKIIAIDGLTTFNRMESAMKNKNGEDILNDLAAKRENKSFFFLEERNISLNLFFKRK